MRPMRVHHFDKAGRTSRARFIVPPVLAAAAAVVATAVARADLLVTNTSDAGPGSLRQAILDADADVSGNPVVISVTATGTLALNSALPPITNDHGVILNGPTGAG